MPHLFPSGSVFVLLAGVATAQSINVDFQPAGSPFGVPSPAYGGSAGAPGVWNAVGTATASNLRAFDGSPTGVSLSTLYTSPGCPTLFFAHDETETSGDDEKLLDDRYSPETSIAIWKFEGLAPGDYDVDTILVLYDGCVNGFHEVFVPGSPDPLMNVAGVWAGSYVQGDPATLPVNPASNFSRHRKTVTDGTLEIQVSVFHPAWYIFVSGIQLNKHEQDFVGTSLCFGDGSSAACPCGNSGQTRTGCQNSAGTGGSWLFASGSPSPDTIVLHAAGELPNALSIFLQGNIVIAPVVYGDGLRCSGGTLKRLYTKTASQGVVFAPQAGDPSITAQSANLGVPISPGGRRYYQVFYRDGNPGFCPVPQGNSFNVSNAVKINW